MEYEELGKKKEDRKRAVSMEFLASISHEIRNPVNVIIGLTHLLRTAETEAEKDRYTNELINTSQVLLELVNNIMDFTKVDAGKLNYEFKVANLRESLLRNLMGFKTVTEAKGLDLLIEVTEQLPLLVYTDPVKINQVILNLLSNALKFTDEGYVKVSVSIQEVRELSVMVKFEVQDTGMGIPAEKLETIFNAFDQGSDEINLKFGGTGLGLSICKKVVSQLGGDLQVQSEVGKGSRFSFILELSSSEKKPIPEKKKELSPVPTGKKFSVLVVDDSEMNTLLTGKILEQENFNVFIADNGFSAIRRLQQERVDLLLLDIHMPRMNGVEAAKIIRNLPGLKELPIIAVTGSTDLSSLEDLKSSVFTDYILKPFPPELLIQKIRITLSSLQEVN